MPLILREPQDDVYAVLSYFCQLLLRSQCEPARFHDDALHDKAEKLLTFLKGQNIVPLRPDGEGSWGYSLLSTETDKEAGVG